MLRRVARTLPASLVRLATLGAVASCLAGCRPGVEPISLPPESTARDSSAIDDRVQTARDRVQHHDNQIDAGWPITEMFVRSVAAAHRELWAAEMALVRSDEERVQVTDAYVRRARRLFELAEARWPADGSRAHAEAAREALAEAEAVSRTGS